MFCLFWKHIRAHSSSLLHAIIAHNHLPFFKIFSNFVHFCPNFQIFCHFLPFFNIFCPFLPFFWKIACMPLLSRIGPAHIISIFRLCIVILPSFFQSLNSSVILILDFGKQPQKGIKENRFSLKVCQYKSLAKKL